MLICNICRLLHHFRHSETLKLILEQQIYENSTEIFKQIGLMLSVDENYSVFNKFIKKYSNRRLFEHGRVYSYQNQSLTLQYHRHTSLVILIGKFLSFKRNRNKIVHKKTEFEINAIKIY